MTFQPQPVMDAHVLCRIYLDGETLKYADSNLSMSDGYYDGRLTASSLQLAFSSFTAPKQRESTMTLTLRDPDMTIRNYLADYTWGNREVEVLVGYGRDIDNYTVDFHGVVKFPGGIGHDRKEVRIKLRDIRHRDVVTLPPNKYWTNDYPNIEDGVEGTSIPIVYGEWSKIPCTCINTSTKQYKIADHRIRSIVQVLKRASGETTWTPISHSSEDLENATFVATDCTPGDDEIAASIEGKCYSAAIADYLWRPMDILRDIYLNYIGVSESALNTDSMDEMTLELGGVMAHRWIGDEISSNTLVEELAIENLFDWFVLDGQYTARSRIPKVAIDRTFDEISIAPNTLRTEADPESLYANRIKCEYLFDPVDNEYHSYHEEDNAAAQSDIGQIVPRTIPFKWLYVTDDIQAVAAHLIILYSHEIDVIQFTAYGEGILTQLSDRIGLTFGHYADRPLLVREVTKHFGTMSCTVFGYDSIKHVLPGYWTDDDAPNYADATAEQRASMGFWTDDDGLADPADETSTVSNFW